MRRFRTPFAFRALVAVAALLAAPAAASVRALPDPPMAKAVPTRFEEHGRVRVDPYYWLKERDDPEVLGYLRAENAYTDSVMAPTLGLQDSLYREITGRIRRDDRSAPYRLGDYLYYTRYSGEGDYPVYCRKKGSPDAPEEVLLDANSLARGHTFFSVRGVEVSSGEDFLAFAVDTVGRRLYTLHVKDLRTGALLPDAVPAITGNLAWAEDDRTVFYTQQDPETLRWYRVYRHVVGTDAGADPLVYEEPDQTFEVDVSKAKSRKYLFITATQTLSTEVRYLDATRPDGEFTVIVPRERDHEYQVEEKDGYFYFRTNDHARNFRLVRAPVATPGKTAWEEVLPVGKDVFLEEFDVFRNAVVAAERREGLVRFHVMPTAGGRSYDVGFDEPAYYATLGVNRDYESPVLRVEYSSLTTPESVYDVDLKTRNRTLVKRQEVLGGFDPRNYRTERVWATARDGVRVPISLVYRRGTRQNGTAPLLLYGYGSYGYSEEAEFTASVVSLLDRGFVYAVAHVRGGSERGRWWYEDGKLLHKKNTFTDFIDCGRYLVAKRYADPHRVFALGGSAGGLLMGAVTNMAPDLWKGVVAEVPFVDVVTTMLDPSIPLTTSEYDEWGNPDDATYYDYMLSYSPMDNVEAKAYPNLLVTTGLHDSQVQYWEPAKWVAKLRATKTDDRLVLLKTNMEAGHGGASGRFKRHRETAFIYAFILDLAGIDR